MAMSNLEEAWYNNALRAQAAAEAAAVTAAEKKELEEQDKAQYVRGVKRYDLPVLKTIVTTWCNWQVGFGCLSPGRSDNSAQLNLEKAARKAGYDSYADQVAYTKASAEYTELLDNKPADFSYKFTTLTKEYNPTTTEMQDALSKLKESVRLEPVYQAAAKAYNDVDKPAGFSYKFTYNPTKEQLIKEYQEATTKAISLAAKNKQVTELQTKLTAMKKPSTFSYTFSNNADPDTYIKEFTEAITKVKEAQKAVTSPGNTKDYGTDDWQSEEDRTIKNAKKFGDLNSPFTQMMSKKYKITDNPYVKDSADWYEKEATNALAATQKQLDWHNTVKQKQGKSAPIQSSSLIESPVYTPVTTQEQRAWHNQQKSIHSPSSPQSISYVLGGSIGGDISTTPEQRAWHDQQKSIQQARRVGSYGKKKNKVHSHDKLMNDILYGDHQSVVKKVKVCKADGDGLMNEILHGSKRKPVAAKKKKSSVKRIDYSDCGI